MTGFDFGGKRVFLSGPMTGMPDWNRAAFENAEREVRAAGAGGVFSPADIAPERGEEPWPHERYMLRTLHELMRARSAPGGIEPAYDAIALLPGWELSEGAKVERMVAEACGIEAVEL